ncbi:MAG: hypothetical protein RIT04_159 [Candidatus Parcubacteria bacterium]|jgi:trigger factor
MKNKAPATKIYSNIAIKKLPKSQVEISGTIEVAHLGTFRAKALKNIGKEISIDGFRKGSVPEKILVSKIGEMPILEEMAELALSSAYPSIIVEEKIDAIGRPRIEIKKLAPGNPLEFSITTTVVPEVTLGDYKKIAKEVIAENKKAGGENVEVTEKDVTDAIDRIRRSYAEHNHVHDESHDKMSKEDHEKMITDSLPELNEEFVAKLGAFSSVADLKEKIKTKLTEDKKDQVLEKRRIAISDKISDATTVEVPELLITSETNRIEAQFRDDIGRMGVPFDDYLKHAKKTLEEIRKEWAPHAEKKAKLQIVLNKIAEAENIAPTEKEIEEEVKHIVEHYKDADKERAYIYAETVLMNEKVFKFLEEQK